MGSHKLILNCTPLGTYPAVNECPGIPYDMVNRGHTYTILFISSAHPIPKAGHGGGPPRSTATVMRVLQAERSWDLWRPTGTLDAACGVKPCLAAAKLIFVEFSRQQFARLRSSCSLHKQYLHETASCGHYTCRYIVLQNAVNALPIRALF